MLFNFFQGIDSSTAELLKPTIFLDNNLKTTQARNFKISLHDRAFIHLSTQQKQLRNLIPKVNEICILFNVVKFLFLENILVLVFQKMS